MEYELKIIFKNGAKDFYNPIKIIEIDDGILRIFVGHFTDPYEHSLADIDNMEINKLDE